MDDSKRTCSGFTLVEAVVVTVIVAILLVAAASAANDLVASAQRRSEAHDLLSFFAQARRQAIMAQKNMTLCPLDEDNNCGRDWNAAIYLFEDELNQRKLSDSARVVSVLNPPSSGRIETRSLSRSYFQYRPNGQILSDLGNITWCPESGEAQQAAHLIISRGGRIRLATDTDGDGVPEKSDGAPVEC